MERLLPDFITFFAVIDPIGTVPVFLAVTQRYPETERRRVALRAAVTATFVLLFFVIAGEIVLRAIGTPLAAFEVAGGIVLFLFALTMIFGESKPDEELRLASAGSETAVFPLAIPSIASPGAMLAAVLRTENDRFTLSQQALTATMMLAVLGITLLFMLAAARLDRLIGSAGASLISRVMGMIIASVAATSVLDGIRDYYAL